VAVVAKSVVSIVKGTDPERMVEEALALLGGVESLIRPRSVVVVKPNAIAGYPPERSITTSPDFVSAVIKILRKARPKEIIMAESSAMTRDTMASLETAGLIKAAEDAGIDRIVDVKSERDLIKIPIRDARSGLTSIKLPRFLVEAEHVVNLPIFKAHVSAVFSCALKNIKGVLSDAAHAQMHQTGLAEAVMDAWSVFKMDLQIADVIHPLEGFGPVGGVPADVGCVVAGKDPVAVDATVCRMVGLDVKRAPFFEPAVARGIGNLDESLIEIRGRTIEEVFTPLWIPYLGGFEQWPEYNIYADGACSSCQGLVGYCMERLKSMGEYEKNAGISIVLGRPATLPQGVAPEDLILLGDCVKKYRDHGLFVSGCPPVEMEPTWTIMDRKFGEDPTKSTREYEQELAVFHDYMVNKKAAAGTVNNADAAKK
jgi:uncharacterized protein (DUF362 family)